MRHSESYLAGNRAPSTGFIVLDVLEGLRHGDHQLSDASTLAPVYGRRHQGRDTDALTEHLTNEFRKLGKYITECRYLFSSFRAISPLWKRASELNVTLSLE